MIGISTRITTAESDKVGSQTRALTLTMLCRIFLQRRADHPRTLIIHAAYPHWGMENIIWFSSVTIVFNQPGTKSFMARLIENADSRSCSISDPIEK
jgi:hypothetical protein